MAKKDAAKMIDPGRYGYGTTKVRGANGKIRHSRGNGDAVARALLGADFDAVLKANGLTERMKAHADKNSGQFRMIGGNMLRALIKKGEPVTIGDHVIKSLTQKVAIPDVSSELKDKPAKKTRRKSKKESGAEAGA